jgi:hypothetical protein
MDWANDSGSAPDSRRRCNNCGAFVTRRFSRVFGDNAGEVYGCLDCGTARDLHNGEQRRSTESPR